MADNSDFKSLNDILNNLNLINLPSSLWGIHIHPKYEYIAVIHINFNDANLTIDKAIIVQQIDIPKKIEAQIFLHHKNVSIPQINPTITSIADLCTVIFAVDDLKICENWQFKNDSCLIYVASGFDKCVMCNTDKQKLITYNFEEKSSDWQNETFQESDDVDCVVKQILELEYTDEPNEIDLSTNIASKEELKCSHCSKMLPNKQSLSRHEKTHLKSGETQLYNCEDCDKSFKSAGHLKVHQRKHTNERPYVCTYEFCGKKFYTNQHLKEHVRLHTNEKPYSCPVCDKKNSHFSAHQRHVLTHSDTRPNLCTICGKTFCVGYRMKDHLATHNEEKNFQCEICDKKFAKATSLNIHRKIHSGEKPHVCKICGKRYTTHSNLGTHIKTHTGEKPYLCGACPARFIHPRLLRIHQRVHTGERPYVCPEPGCGKAFGKNIHLTVHRRMHSGEKPYVCTESGCTRAFTTSGNLGAHKRVHHQTSKT